MTTLTLNDMKTKIESSRFMKHLGFEVEEFTEEKVALKLKITDHALNVNGTLHGGIQASMLDNITGMAVRAKTKTDCVTLNLNIHYLSAISEGEIYATATIIQQGHKILTVEGEIRTSQGVLVSKGVGVFKVISQKKVER
ncbi:PaaI family thioesterase [Alkalihalobacillus deserti]|uniref:PaaI family thioesterase n=1 Tax=Alkalihalobacillus deserti TaxID=2879466 RepID=UPI001D136ED6|nr:PaaI family thioesterase [Alkalihalobacillus deserti]